MNINYENKLFNGSIVDGMPEGNIALSPSFYSEQGLTAGKLNELRLRVLEVQKDLYEKLNKLEMDIVEWNIQEKEINNNLTNCETIINDRLFLRSDTDGFYKSVYYDFHGQETDPLLAPENVEIDIVNHCVRLANANTKLFTNNEVLESYRRIPTSSYSVEVSRTPETGTERVATVPGSSIALLADDTTTNGWTGVVSTLTPHSVGLTFNIIFNSPTEVGEMYIGITDSSVKSKISAVVTDDMDTSYIILENADAINSNVIYVNRKVKAIQVLLTKNAYDEIVDGNTAYRYIFNIKKLIVNKKQKDFEKSGLYFSKFYALQNVNQFALEVCDFVEPNVNGIDYQLAVGDDKGFGLYPINPINKMPGSAPYGLKLFNTQIVNNIQNINPLVDTADTVSLVDIKDISTLYSFDNQYKVVNYLIDASQNGLQSANIFINYSNERSNNPELIEKIGKYYYTWVYADKSEEKKIDFGNSGVVVEGFVPTSDLSDVFNFDITSNVIYFNKTGWFKIKIPANSYYSVGSEFSSLEELKDLDPLFPYNAKYLVEGTNLKIDPYGGFTRRARTKLMNTNNISSISNKEYYLLRYNNVKDSITKDGFCVILNKEIDAKNCYIEHYKKRSETVLVGLMATLKTSDSSSTPILSSFKIKIGE